MSTVSDVLRIGVVIVRFAEYTKFKNAKLFNFPEYVRLVKERWDSLYSMNGAWSPEHEKFNDFLKSLPVAQWEVQRGLVEWSAESRSFIPREFFSFATRPKQSLTIQQPRRLKAAPVEQATIEAKAAPAEQPAPAPVEITKATKQTKRRGTGGRMSRGVRLNLAVYARLRVEQGLLHLPALEAAAQAQAEANGIDRNIMFRRIRDAVRERLSNGRDVRKLRRFLEDCSKTVSRSKTVKK